ncbi:hypothetical protein [Erythrobacter oryzae]|uniref:hypothetical protein n=1 Tax=Erythrobacter oryzae TaxID=3019556 RepID=UPI0025527123|nr:hypothetical protein [Erythrobacter sp. COR-2]
MATKERKYKGSLTLGKLETACEAEEQAYGTIIKIEALGGWSVATYDNAEFPPLQSLAFVPKAGGIPAPAPAHATFLFDGTATALGVEIPVSVYRTS